MNKQEEKNHWYDGWFYDKFIAPNQDNLFNQIKEIIEPGAKIIDVGCGTGRFSFMISEKCSEVLGIDLSFKNIRIANNNLLKNPAKKIHFEQQTLKNLITRDKKHFNYAVSTYVIHEINEEDRISILKEMAEAADKIIIGDYLSVGKRGFMSMINEVVEFAAGRDHYRNYKNYMANGGIRELALRAGLKIVQEYKDRPVTSHLVVLTK